MHTVVHSRRLENKTKSLEFTSIQTLNAQFKQKFDEKRKASEHRAPTKESTGKKTNCLLANTRNTNTFASTSPLLYVGK